VFEGADRRSERIEMLTRQSALIHRRLQLRSLHSLLGTLHRPPRATRRPARRTRVDRCRIHPGTTCRELAQPLIQIDLTRLQEPHQPGNITQQPGHPDLVEQPHIRVSDPREPVDHRRRPACHTPSRY
jgi:hypothetical protein